MNESKTPPKKLPKGELIKEYREYAELAAGLKDDEEFTEEAMTRVICLERELDSRPDCKEPRDIVNEVKSANFKWRAE